MEQPDFPYYSSVDQIYHAEWSIKKHVRLALLRRSIQTLWPNGHPTRLIHVAGTGGKGSTCRFLELGCGCVSKAGAFMSPHLFDYRERFSIGGQFAARRDIQTIWTERIQPHCVQLALDNSEHTHSFHEVSILIALALFEQHHVEWAAIETGVGGRFDQTRALDVAASVLTNVGSDHAHMLGSEKWQRTLDKAGIARRGMPFFTTETDPESLEIIAAVCEDAGAPLRVIGRPDVAELEEQLHARNGHRLTTESLLSAEYQRWNAALSYAVVDELFPAVDKDCVLDAFLGAELLGRFWQVEERVYADIAHNAEKISALAGEIDKRFGDMGKILIMGIAGRRVPSQVFASLAKVARAIIVTGASYKGQDPGKVRSEIESLTGDTPTLVISEPRQALQIAKSMQGESDVVILTGSTYMIEQVLNPDPYLRHLSGTFGWRVHVDNEATGTVQLTLPKSPSLVR